MQLVHHAHARLVGVHGDFLQNHAPFGLKVTFPQGRAHQLGQGVQQFGQALGQGRGDVVGDPLRHLLPAGGLPGLERPQRPAVAPADREVDVARGLGDVIEVIGAVVEQVAERRPQELRLRVLAGAQRGHVAWMEVARPAAMAQLLLVGGAFAVLTAAFVYGVLVVLGREIGFTLSLAGIAGFTSMTPGDRIRLPTGVVSRMKLKFIFS